VLVDDGRLVNRFGSLINPGISIPASLTAIHGISNEMVRDAPAFSDLAEQILELLEDRIFVAHNVHFDYGFLEEEFRRHGYDFRAKKLCTVRLSRKLLRLRSHSLASLCLHFSIENEKAHRALEDATATARILKYLLEMPACMPLIKEMTKGRAGIFKGPGNLPEEKLKNLPESIGVYQFFDSSGKVIYVGKAINLKDRVHQHFGAQTHTKEKSQFLESVYDLSFTECGHELMALMTENELIKKHYPRFNRLNKDFRLNYGIYEFEDQRGFRRLLAGQSGKWSRPLRVFRKRDEAVQLLLKISMENGLCLRLNGLTNGEQDCRYLSASGYSCLACSGEAPDFYNQQVEKVTEQYFRMGKVLMLTKGRRPDEHGAVYMENGKILGYGYLEMAVLQAGPELEIRQHLLPYYDTQDAQSILRPWLEQSREGEIVKENLLVLEAPEHLHQLSENHFSELNPAVI
jgi:DNA polymerase-3 subunit epsilon